MRDLRFSVDENLGLHSLFEWILYWNIYFKCTPAIGCIR